MKKYITLLIIILFHAFTFAQPSAEAKNSDSNPKPTSVIFSPPKFRIGAQVGYGHRIAKIPFEAHPTMKNHLTKLKRNVSFWCRYVVLL